TNTAKEIWDNVEMLMQGSGRTLQQRKEDLFDEFERFRAIGNEPIRDYFVRFHKLVNDMKITQLEIPTHQLNTKFVNNLPSYWGKYVTNVKQNMDISTTNYVHIYTHLKAYEPHATKTLKKQEQSSSIIDPLAYMAQATPTTSLPPPSTSQPQPAVLSPNDAMMATMTQIANLLFHVWECDLTKCKGMRCCTTRVFVEYSYTCLRTVSTSKNDSSYKYLYEFDESHEALHIFRDIFQNIIKAF
ncbi:hypothetical protein Tco_0848641, partial [Tanacetum coccineum]